MMKNSIIITIICLGIFFKLSALCYAAGIGAYGSAGGGSMLYIKPDDNFIMREAISKATIFSSGFIADTNLSMEKVFNYRIKVGYDFQKSTDPSFKNMNRVTMTHIFGAGLFRNNVLRIWLGPQLGFGYFHARYVYLNMSALSFRLYLKNSVLIESLNLHAGMSVGINLNAEENVTVPIEAGFKYNFYADFENYSKNRGIKSLFSLMGPEGYASIGIMYRFNELQAIKEEEKQ